MLGSVEFTQHQQLMTQDLSFDKIVMTLQEWTDLAKDMLEEGQKTSSELTASDEAQYRQFVKIANSLLTLLTDKDKR